MIQLRIFLGLYFLFLVIFFLVLIYYINYISQKGIKGDSSPLIIKMVVISATIITIISVIAILLVPAGSFFVLLQAEPRWRLRLASLLLFFTDTDKMPVIGIPNCTIM